MFLDWTEMSLAAGFKCQIPIFGQATEQDTWHLGKVLLSSYYSVYDATQLTDDGGYLQVGMGRINPDDDIGGKIIDQRKKDAIEEANK